tara:strand:- start:576 stop:1079 length:504 start_codon:yes stop_codon:yes gene_type:complete
MSEEELRFFDENIEKLIDDNTITYFLEIIHLPEVQEVLRNLPPEIKEQIIKISKLKNEEKYNSILSGNSWDEYYEMYDGKFDEKHMLHITINIENEIEIIELGYTKQSVREGWHKPLAGEYKLNNNGDIVIVHSCPDREIFEIDAKQYLDDLLINPNWVKETIMSIM